MPRETSQRSHRAAVDRSGSTWMRSRAATACQVCRVRRTKCDNNRPCSSCQRLGLSCTSEKIEPTTGFDPASLQILARIDGLYAMIRELAHTGNHSPGTFAGLGTNALVSELSIGQQDSTRARECNVLHLDQEQGNLRQVLYEWDVWGPHTPPHISGPHEELPLTGSRHSTNLPMEISSVAGLVGYLDDFFRNVHVKNPILNERLIREQQSNIVLWGLGWDARSCLLLLLLANGALSSPFPQHYPRSAQSLEEEQRRQVDGKTLFDAAQKRLGAVFDADCLTRARCSFYSGVFCMVSMRPLAAWQHFLQGVAICQQLRALSGEGEGNDDRQPEESVYWSCWKSERELRLELDLPDFRAVNAQHPAMFPSLPMGAENDLDHLHTWYFYLAEISLWRIETAARLSISELVETKTAYSLEELADRIGQLEAPLLSWQQSLPSAINFDDTDNTDVLRFCLKGRLTYNYEVITWPLVAILAHQPSRLHGRALELATQGARMHYERLSINRPGFYHRHHGTWLMQQSSARSACILIAIARGDAAHRLPVGWYEAVSSTIDMLDYWDKRPGDSVAIFLRTVLTQVTVR